MLVLDICCLIVSLWTLNPLSLLSVALFQGEDVPKKIRSDNKRRQGAT